MSYKDLKQPLPHERKAAEEAAKKDKQDQKPAQEAGAKKT